MTAACYSTEIACGQKVPSSTHFSRTPSGVVALQSPDTEPWKTDAAAELASGFFNFLVPILVWGLIGLMIAVLTRSSGTAIGVGIGWLLVVENLIGITAPDLTHLMPGGTLSALASGGTADLSWVSALGLTLLYGAVAASVSLFAFRNRDIVS